MRQLDLIVVHHSASREATHTWDDIRSWHRKKGWQDIGYHYGIVFDDGKWQVKTGRSLDAIGAHAKGFNRTSIGVCFEGNYEENDLPPHAYALGLYFLGGLCTTFFIPPDRVLGHRELPYATACPGKNFPLDKLRAELMAQRR